MGTPRFVANLASTEAIWAYLEREQKRTREDISTVAASMELALQFSTASEPLRQLLEWFGENEPLSQPEHSLFQNARRSLVGRYINVSHSLLPPVFVELFQPLRQLERIALPLLVLQRRIAPLLEEVRQKPTLGVLLHADATQRMMVAFADFMAERLGIELANRELAALAILIGHEDPTSDQKETDKRVWKWTDARRHSKEILAALKELARQSPPSQVPTSPAETALDAVDTMTASGPSPAAPSPAPSPSLDGNSVEEERIESSGSPTSPPLEGQDS
jgi:hypothetical protein